MDAALVNNWEEMSGTHYNMQPYTNVFMSWYSVGGWMPFHTDGVKQENTAGLQNLMTRTLFHSERFSAGDGHH